MWEEKKNYTHIILFEHCMGSQSYKRFFWPTHPPLLLLPIPTLVAKQLPPHLIQDLHLVIGWIHSIHHWANLCFSDDPHQSSWCFILVSLKKKKYWLCFEFDIIKKLYEISFMWGGSLDYLEELTKLKIKNKTSPSKLTTLILHSTEQ